MSKNYVNLLSFLEWVNVVNKTENTTQKDKNELLLKEETTRFYIKYKFLFQKLNLKFWREKEWVYAFAYIYLLKIFLIFFFNPFYLFPGDTTTHSNYLVCFSNYLPVSCHGTVILYWTSEWSVEPLKQNVLILLKILHLII